jgi:hypothetical protein
MAYQSRSSPHSTSSHEEWDGKSKMSKTQSTASAAYSISSSSSRQTNSSIQESSARTYFVELGRYLTSMLLRGNL